ncbi:early endosome antigen 1 isoform X2 [Drosophila biarmipes]|uniref:early endosome antigen 1 isoform X2 n=1 Tax=Drosophila biarmipes TaxID=125945 RepID=UPI0007E5DEE8|nr:early endosome antigen 1 isoform X2 [Drosophila biarmipes]
MSSRQAGFVLDAKSMNLSTSRPPSPSPAAATFRCQESQQSNASQLDARAAEESSLETSTQVQSSSSTESISTDYYRCLLQKLRDATGDAGKMSFELNNIFLKRLDEIDCLDGQGGDAMYTSQLRLVTYQEWVDILLHVNNVVLGNMSDLEEEAYGKIMDCVQSVQGEQQQALEVNRKLQKDICALIKLVQTAHHHGTWDLKGLSLETMTVKELMGVGADEPLPESESEKMAECMKSLVSEMAAKHDELCHLKSQIGALDEVILTARQKLLLKDQCIAQLNQQLQEITECFATMSEHTKCMGPSTNVNSCGDLGQDQAKLEETASDTLTGDTITNNMLENLTMQDSQESEMLRMLNRELNEVFELHHKQDYQAMECSRKRLSCFFEKLTSERDDTVRKLESIRSHLRILQSDIDQSWLNSVSSRTGPGDPDTQMLEALRRRMHNLAQSNRELHGKYQRLDTESKIKISELQARIESESGFSQRNSEILKEIAEMICKLGSVEFSYNEIYEESSTENPFCAAIKEIIEQRSEEERKQMACNEHLACQIEGLQDNLKDRDSQIDQLQSMIRSYSDFSENNRLKGEIHELKQKNCDLSRQVREMATLLSNQEEQRVELCTKYGNLVNSFEDQCQELKAANRRVQSLQGKLDQLEQLQGEMRTERKMLREEVIALKEKEAVSAGRERALQDQQKNFHLEVEKQRQTIRELHTQLRLEESRFHDSQRQMEEVVGSMKKEICDSATKHQQALTRLKQQTEVNQQQEQIIGSFRKWKDAQVRADDAMRQCAKRAEEHIHMLLEENQALAEDYRSLFRDHTLLETEIYRVKQAVNYAPSSSLACPPQASGRRTNAEAENDMDRRLQSLTSTSQRISNQNRTLNEQLCNPLSSRSPSGIGRPVAQSTLRPATGSSNDLS